jgi:hypothetical protein
MKACASHKGRITQASRAVAIRTRYHIVLVAPRRRIRLAYAVCDKAAAPDGA